MFVVGVWFIRILASFLLILVLLFMLTKINLHINFNKIDNNIYITYLGIIKYTLYQNGTRRNGDYYKNKVKKLQKKMLEQAQKANQDVKLESKQRKMHNPLFDSKYRSNEVHNKIGTLKNIFNLIKNNKKSIAIIKALLAHISINFNIKYIYFYSDPHITAFFYGVLNSIKFNLDFLLCQYFKSNRSEVLICPDFEKRENNIDISIKLSIRLLNLFVLTLKLVPIILKYKKLKKAV